MSTIDFSGRVAIITGAGGGLGREYALRLAERGAHVVVNDLGSDAAGFAADRVVEEIRAAGGTAIANHAAIGARAAAEEIVAAALESFGRIDILINNAGNQANNRFELMSDAEFDSVLEVHLKGAFTLTQLVYREMMKRKYGRILFTSSSSGMLGHFIRSNYSSAKAALVGLMHSVSLEGRTHGIFANALLPTAAGSKLGKVPPGTLLPEWEPQMPERQPEMALIGAAMTFAKVAPLVLYLVSERCTTTHAMYSAAAGRYARVFVGITHGWMAPLAHTPTPEEIEAHFEEIEDRASFEVPYFLPDELIAIARRVKPS
jgi:NAD(P)-dependent dehydrogenase (short-subunit alcohol dehydrogenase family)